MRGPREVLDELLVLSCQNGDADALDLLARRWNERLLSHAFRITGDPDEAAEAVQEAWLGIVRGIRRLDDPRRFGGWALAIVRNKCRDGIRREVRRRSGVERWATDPTVGGPGGRETVAPGGSRSASIRRLRAAIAGLSEDRRAILRLFYLEDRPVAEIAELLELPAGTVKSRLFYARRELRETLASDPAETDDDPGRRDDDAGRRDDDAGGRDDDARGRQPEEGDER